MPKNNRSGKAARIYEEDYVRIFKRIRSSKYKLLASIARYTGERWGAIVQLRVDDVYHKNGEPREVLVFRARTRKASPSGQRLTREVFCHPSLFQILQAYSVLKGEWLFPNRENDGHISISTAEKVLRKAVGEAGLSHRGISTHSTRVTFITQLHENGIDLHTIQQITGHKDLKVLTGYIQSSPERTKRAIASL